MPVEDPPHHNSRHPKGSRACGQASAAHTAFPRMYLSTSSHGSPQLESGTRGGSTLRPRRPLFGAFWVRDYPVHLAKALISSVELSPFLACTGREAAASSQGPQRPVQGERWHVGVAPPLQPRLHTTSSFTTVKCLARSDAPRMWGSHTEQQSPGTETTAGHAQRDPPLSQSSVRVGIRLG